jgi:pimeloyl-ACP methyl ester carboxylesterase
VLGATGARPDLHRDPAVRSPARPRRGLYTTAQTVDDIEALRVANGYGKLVLYGVSYGTKVA